MSKLIDPKVLKGFRDYLPELMIPRKNMINQLQNIFESFGFAPIDTPILEYTEILLGKGGNETDKQIYRFEDQGGRDVAIRFDLTVPLSRFVAKHYNILGMPFKAYHIGKVLRGENTHKGRYREFYQCDFDILGGTSSYSDFEILQMIYKSINGMIGSDEFTININNRFVLNGLMSELDLIDKTTDILRILDKLDKMSQEKVKLELKKLSISDEKIKNLLDFVSFNGSNKEAIKFINDKYGNNPEIKIGLQLFEDILNFSNTLEISKNIKINLSIARGLDYYTGIIFETTLNNLKGIGSICSGGRYDNLANLYTKNKIPGVGASVGLDRLLAAMEELKLLKQERKTANILLTTMDNNYLNEYLKIADELRKNNLNVELYTESKKIDKQLKYANRKNIELVLILGEDEFKNNQIKLKNMITGENFTLDQSQIVEFIIKLNSK